MEICPDGTYADTTTQNCEGCLTYCLKCFGSGSNQCKLCDSTKGYILESGKCIKMLCGEGTYLELGDVARCMPCDEVCSLCDGPGACSECRKGYLGTPIPDANSLKCESPPKGCRLMPDGSCQGIVE